MVLTDTNEKRIENYNLRNFTRLKDIFESFLTCWKVQNKFFIVELVDSVKNKKEYSFSGLFEYGDFYYEWCIKHRIWLERDTQKQRLELVLPNDKFFDNSLSQYTEAESNLYREYWIEMTDEQNVFFNPLWDFIENLSSNAHFGFDDEDENYYYYSRYNHPFSRMAFFNGFKELEIGIYFEPKTPDKSINYERHRKRGPCPARWKKKSENTYEEGFSLFFTN